MAAAIASTNEKPGLPNFDAPPPASAPRKLINKDKASVSVGMPFAVKHVAHVGVGNTLGGGGGGPAIPAPIADGKCRSLHKTTRLSLFFICRCVG